MQEIIDLLHSGNYSCVIKNEGGIHTFSRRGIADLYDLVKDRPSFLKGAFLADKVIGKGAAALAIEGGVQEIYTDIISQPALDLLSEAGIKTHFDSLVPYIHNRENTDWCPLEKLCFPQKSVNEILPVIDSFIQSMRNKRA